MIDSLSDVLSNKVCRIKRQRASYFGTRFHACVVARERVVKSKRAVAHLNLKSSNNLAHEYLKDSYFIRDKVKRFQSNRKVANM